MKYQIIDPTTIEPPSDHPCDRRSISGPANLSNIAVVHYEMAPGEQLPTEYHYHEIREELFYILNGEMCIETPERTYHVRQGRFFIVKPESPHRAYNSPDAETNAQVLGMGAPSFDPGYPYEP